MGNRQVGFFTYTSAVEGPDYNYNPNYNQEVAFHDYTAFYAGIGICTAILGLIILLNILFACCSPWRKYWMNRGTGNRLVLPVFILPPKDQEPLVI